MSLLSCYVMTYNSEGRLAQALNSLGDLADELVVVDSGSTDRTESIARQHGARFFTRKLDSFTAQRLFCVAQCTHEWVLTIDADEEISDQLRGRLEELKGRLGEDGTEAFGIRRVWYFLGREVHCFYPSCCPDQPIRLFRKDKATYVHGRHVHESMTGFSRSKPLEEPILHFTAESVDEAYAKVNQYSTLAARDARAQGRRSGWIKILTLPWLLAAKWYLVNGGWKDGTVGVVHALYVRDMTYLKWLKLREDLS